MAIIVVTFPINRYESLLNGSTATLEVFPLSLGIIKGDIIQINEVDALSLPTGRLATGMCTKIVAGQFFSLPVSENMYYIENLVFLP